MAPSSAGLFNKSLHFQKSGLVHQKPIGFHPGGKKKNSVTRGSMKASQISFGSSLQLTGVGTRCSFRASPLSTSSLTVRNWADLLPKTVGFPMDAETYELSISGKTSTQSDFSRIQEREILVSQAWIDKFLELTGYTLFPLGLRTDP